MHRKYILTGKLKPENVRDEKNENTEKNLIKNFR